MPGTKKPADHSAGFLLRSNRGQLLGRGGLAFYRSNFFYRNSVSRNFNSRRFGNRSNFHDRGSLNDSRGFFFLATGNDEQGRNGHNSKLVHGTYLTRRSRGGQNNNRTACHRYRQHLTPIRPHHAGGPES